MTLVEPALIVAVGAIVLVLVITYIVPLFGAFGSLL
jgi:type II secretory pathway component PulF